MNLPLYLAQDFQYPEEWGRSGHAGVWFERFASMYNADFSDISEDKDKDKGSKANWLKQFNGLVGDGEAIEKWAGRQLSLVNAMQGHSQVFSSVWHFVTGMGNPHPVENGFAWHPTLGVPYLTGAAVKGIVRAYLENYYPDQSDKKALLLNWFGSTNKDPGDDDYQSQTGNLIFFDAIPIKPVMLTVDIMTPHMGEWYAKGGSDPNTSETLPADWHAPTPIPFLAAKDICLLFSFALRQHGKAAKKPDIDLVDVADVLQLALTQFGAGAKTATGYGVMELYAKGLEDLEAKQKDRQKKQQERRIELEKQAKRERELAQMHPIEREIAEFTVVLDAIKALEGGQWESDQHVAAQFIKKRMQAEKFWKESSAARKPEKDKEYQRTLIVMKYL